MTYVLTLYILFLDTLAYSVTFLITVRHACLGGGIRAVMRANECSYHEPSSVKRSASMHLVSAC